MAKPKPTKIINAAPPGSPAGTPVVPYGVKHEGETKYGGIKYFVGTRHDPASTDGKDTTEAVRTPGQGRTVSEEAAKRFDKVSNQVVKPLLEAEGNSKEAIERIEREG